MSNTPICPQELNLTDNPHVLVVDDDPDILTAARLMLRRKGFEAHTLQDPSTLPRALEKDLPDAVVLDLNFNVGDASCETGLKWLSFIAATYPDLAVVIITAHGDVAVAVEAMKLGAMDFVTKPWDNDKFLGTIHGAIELTTARREANSLRTQNKGLSQSLAAPSKALIGSSPAMLKVFDLISRAAPSEANVLILGENGTGKEVVASEIHRLSGRSDNVFLPVDLGSVPDTLFESELFGHKKGAFTDAKVDRVGRFEAANRGTIFLDEIGNLPQHLQPKLLSVLERREIVPVGETKARPIDVRLLAATNMPREQMLDEDVFRQDLLYRINTVTITLPPLRDRREDVPQLVEHFLGAYSKKYGQARRRISNAAIRHLTDYDWPGNVRALLHAVERAVILSQNDTLEPDDFLLEAPRKQSVRTAGSNTQSLNLETLEHDAIDSALRKHAGNISRAAEELGLTRASLYRRMAKHGLE